MKISVMFICLGNICRSPALEATLRHLAIERDAIGRLHIDSCGIGWDHIGERPDRRSFEAAKKRGVLIDHTAQQFSLKFLDEYDHLFCADREILEQVKYRAKNSLQSAKIALATAYSLKYPNQDIPDPYYFDRGGFDGVMDIIVDSCEGILNHLHI